MGRLQNLRDIYSKQFTAPKDITEPYRVRTQRVMNAAKVLNKIALSVAVVVGLGEPALTVAGHPEVADQITEVAVYFAGVYAVAGAVYSTGLAVMQEQNSRAQEVA